MPRITFRCPECHSTEVVRDAYATWNSVTQE